MSSILLLVAGAGALLLLAVIRLLGAVHSLKQSMRLFWGVACLVIGAGFLACCALLWTPTHDLLHAGIWPALPVAAWLGVVGLRTLGRHAVHA